MTSRRTVLLRHADARVPRYTSYPTAPHFTAAVTPGVYGEWLERLGDGPDTDGPETDGDVSLYLHVPYCRDLCWYCGCHTRATRRAAPVARYLDHLAGEIDLVADRIPRRLTASHVHWGGGTPTIAPARRIAAITEQIARSFDLAADAEIAIEIDPRAFTPDMAGALAAAGVNRASLGVQTFDGHVQHAINRVQTFDEVARAVDALRDAGIARISFDLLYGLPHQTEASCRAAVHAALLLGPDRLSVFGYAHVPHMKPHQRMIDEDALPDVAERIAQADAIAGTLAEAGYVAVGIDHYARSDDPMARDAAGGRLKRNFQGYTTDRAAALIGFGASAIGRLPQGYVQNAPSTAAWAQAIADGRFATARGWALTREDQLRAEIIERLMCDLEVDLDAVAAAHGAPAPAADLSALEADGVVRRIGARIVIDPAYRALARNVAAAFDARLGTGSARHARAV